MSVRGAARRLALGLVVIGEIGAPCPDARAERLSAGRLSCTDAGNGSGRVVIDTEAAYKLWQEGARSGSTSSRHRAARNFAAAGIMDAGAAPQYSGSLWLPDVGRGASPLNSRTYFHTHLEDAVKVSATRPDRVLLPRRLLE